MRCVHRLQHRPFSSSSSIVLSSIFLILLPPISATTWYLKKPLDSGIQFKAAEEEEKPCYLGKVNLNDPKFNRVCEEVDKELARVYCFGPIIAAVNYYRTEMLFNNDSKHFVDRPLRKSAKETLEDFNKRFGNKQPKDMDREQLADFLRNYFGKADGALEPYAPKDWQSDPPKLRHIKDPKFKEWAKALNELWKELGRKMPAGLKDAKNHSLLYVPHPFVVPGGRFREFYYWDAYWIVRGLLASGMTESVKYMCQNFAEMVERFGFVPNGGRIYYNKRSQPPFLTLMVYEYYTATGDKEYLKEVLPVLKKEFDHWQHNRSVKIDVGGVKSDFYQYKAESNVPRPESFCQDVKLVKDIPGDKEKGMLWNNVASAAESGWDFSSRWMKKAEKEEWKLITLKTTDIVPVDLNALICGNLRLLSHLYLQLGEKKKAADFHKDYQLFRESFQALFFKEEDGMWYDFDLKKGKLNDDRYYGSVAVPLFAHCYHTLELRTAERMFQHLEQDPQGVLKHPFGVPTSTINTAQQWDFPNIWPPLTHMLIEGLRRSGTKNMMDKAKQLAEKWVSANYKMYTSCGKHMWEKMAADTGTPGGGGEYTVQIGFGWTNGAVLDLLVTYGREFTFDNGSFPEINCKGQQLGEEPDIFPPM